MPYVFIILSSAEHGSHLIQASSTEFPQQGEPQTEFPAVSEADLARIIKKWL